MMPGYCAPGTREGLVPPHGMAEIGGTLYQAGHLSTGTQIPSVAGGAPEHLLPGGAFVLCRWKHVCTLYPVSSRCVRVLSTTCASGAIITG